LSKQNWPSKGGDSPGIGGTHRRAGGGEEQKSIGRLTSRLLHSKKEEFKKPAWAPPRAPSNVGKLGKPAASKREKIYRHAPSILLTRRDARLSNWSKPLRRRVKVFHHAGGKTIWETSGPDFA